jgi:Flp pilus assembly protein TadD
MRSQHFEEKLQESYNLLLTGNSFRALMAFKNLIDHRPREVRAWMGYGLAAFRDGQMDLAQGALRTAKRLEPKNLEVLLNLGHQYQSMGQMEMARMR